MSTSKCNPSPMMSQLSARLLSSRVLSTITATTTAAGTTTSGYSSSTSSSDDRIVTNHPYQPSLSIASSNGYSADQSTLATSLPSNIKCSNNNSSKMKRTNPTDGTSCTSSSSSTVCQPEMKRLKIQYNTDEINYLASCTTKTIIHEHQGSFPKLLHTDRPRMFPPKSNVNMSNVSHKYASEYASPHIGNESIRSSTMKNHYMGCTHELNSLLQCTASYYSFNTIEQSKLVPPPLRKVVELLQQQPMSMMLGSTNNNYEREVHSDSESSTSSITISDNGSSVPNNATNNGRNHPLASLLTSSSVSDGTMDPKDYDNTNCKNQKGPQRPATSIISIGDALSISRRPRIITLAQAPYNIVQVNAAFLRLLQKHKNASNSSSSSKIIDQNYLGKPLHELLNVQDSNAESLISGLKSCTASKQKVSITGYPNVLLLSSNTVVPSGGSAACMIQRISIIPVGVPPKTVQDTIDSANITHFAIKFTTQHRSASLSGLQQHGRTLNMNSDTASTTSLSSDLSSSSLSRNNNHHNNNHSSAINVMG